MSRAMLFLETPCEQRPEITSPDVDQREREACGAPTLDSAASFSLRVVTRVPVAPRLYPLGDLEFVVELKHDLLLLRKKREPG